MSFVFLLWLHVSEKRVWPPFVICSLSVLSLGFLQFLKGKTKVLFCPNRSSGLSLAHHVCVSSSITNWERPIWSTTVFYLISSICLNNRLCLWIININKDSNYLIVNVGVLKLLLNNWVLNCGNRKYWNGTQ